MWTLLLTPLPCVFLQSSNLHSDSSIQPKESTAQNLKREIVDGTKYGIAATKDLAHKAGVKMGLVKDDVGPLGGSSTLPGDVGHAPSSTGIVGERAPLPEAGGGNLNLSGDQATCRGKDCTAADCQSCRK